VFKNFVLSYNACELNPLQNSVDLYSELIWYFQIVIVSHAAGGDAADCVLQMCVCLSVCECNHFL